MNNLIDNRRAEIAELCRRLHVRRLDAFGSAVKGSFDPRFSDLDFLVEFEPLAPAEYAEAYFALKESLEAVFGRPVDLVNPATVENPYFRESVEASRESIYAG